MQISTKFGLREIVTTHQKRLGDRIIPDLIGDPDFDQEAGRYPEGAAT